jgi:lysophospholipase L1-like esterase
MNTDRIFLVLVPLIRPFVKSAARTRRNQFEAAPLVEGRVVFLGDSITQGGFWDAWFPELPSLNRGINGDTTEDVLDRLDGSIFKPKAVSLLVGTNDLHGAKRLHDPAGIALRVREIVRRIQQAAPEATILLNSVTPRTSYFAPRIRSLNDRYRTIAAETGIVYVDLWPALADSNGALKKDFTTDNLHLIAPGYRAWTDVLRPHLTPLEAS